MVQQLETDLREALAARADELPADAASRIRGRDYRPRTQRLGPPAAAGALLTAVAAGVGVWLVALGPGTTPAFAGWTAKPTGAPHAQVALAVSGCQTHAGTQPRTRGDLPAGAPKLSPPPGAPAPSVRRLKPVLTDTRGPFTFVIFAGGRFTASCIAGPSFAALSAGASRAPVSVPAGRAQLAAASKTGTPDGRAYSFVEGRTGAGVTAVRLVLDDGTRVTTTAAHGWFVAWWPGRHDVRTAEVTTASGTNTQKLAAPSIACPPPPAQGRLVHCTTASGAPAHGEQGAVLRQSPAAG